MVHTVDHHYYHSRGKCRLAFPLDTFRSMVFALEYNDYPLANHGLFFEDIKSYNRTNRMRALGLGSAVFVLTSIPVVNFFAMPVAVAGATRLTTNIKNSSAE